MIYIFNESDSAIWEVREKNEFFYHIGLVNSRFGIDILKRDIDTSEFIVNSLNTPGKLMVLSSNSFNVCYNNKSGLPFLKSVVNVNDYSQDLYILSYKIPEKMETVFEKNGKFNILYTKFDSKSGMIHIIGTAKPSNNPFYYITFADENGNNFVTKHLTTLKKNSSTTIFIQDYTREEVEKCEFKTSIIGNTDEIKKIRLRPSKTLIPYSVIVYPFKNTTVADYCNNKFNKDSNHTKYVDQESKYMMSELRKLNGMKYCAATFYVNKNFVEIDPQEDLKAIRGASIFNKVNYMTADGRIVCAE